LLHSSLGVVHPVSLEDLSPRYVLDGPIKAMKVRSKLYRLKLKYAHYSNLFRYSRT
jgi:hypothetical protein